MKGLAWCSSLLDELKTYFHGSEEYKAFTWYYFLRCSFSLFKRYQSNKSVPSYLFLLFFYNLFLFQKSVVSEQSKTYSLLNEDHTLGNSLRHVLMQDPNTEFCGYTVPHPSEPILHLRLQTKDNTTSDKTILAGAKTLKQMCDHILTEYDKALEKF